MTPVPLFVVALVLIAAAVHAIWNSVVKRGSDKLFSSILVATGCGFVAACALPFLPPIARESWPYVVTSGLAQILYTALLAATYKAGDFSQTYPVMRGTAPLIVALASGPFIGEPLSPMRWLGVALISFGIAAMAFLRTQDQERPLSAIAFAVLNAAVIATYTVVDGLGVRRSGSPVAYAFWSFVLAGVPLVTWAVVTYRRRFLDYAVRHWRVVAVGGVGTMTSYTLVVWAMAIAPVAVVASLRETSILFATAISAFVLRESVPVSRLAAIGMIVAGAVTVRGF